jgi:glucokinase
MGTVRGMTALGIDLGGTKIQAVVLDDGDVRGSARSKTPSADGDAVVAEVARCAEEALREAGRGVGVINGIGIGTPGAVDTATGTVSNASNVAGFKQSYPLAERLSAALGGLPTTVVNDVTAAVLGEHRHGAGRPYDDLIGVFVGTGVGGGLVLGGELWTGHGSAGEIGHAVVQDGGRLCPCGRLGCLEAYAGRRALERTARELMEQGEQTSLFDVMRAKGRDRVTSSVFKTALDDGDPVITRLIGEATWALGVAIASAQNLLDVEAVIIGGGLADKLGPSFVAAVADELAPRVFGQQPAVLPSRLGDLSGAIGAAVAAG